MTAAVSSNYFSSVSGTSYVIGNIDIVYSEFSTTLSNELALNVALTGELVLRASLATGLDDATDEEFADAKNKLGV